MAHRQRQRLLTGATKPLQNLAAESGRLAHLVELVIGHEDETHVLVDGPEAFDAHDADGLRDGERHSLVTDVVELPRRIHQAPDDALDGVVGEDAAGDVGRVEAAAGVLGRSDWF
jgi:hypothetical protein